LALAVHNFHDQRKFLPAGGCPDQIPFGLNAGTSGWGSSWFVYILPHLEQNVMFEKMQLLGQSGWGAQAGNGTFVANRISIEAMLCPSSPLERWCSSPHGASPAVSPQRLMAPTYVGISGAVNGLGGPAFVEHRNATPNSSPGCCSGGIVSGGGILIPGPGFTPKHFGSITDGTSNTAMIGENGDFMTTVNLKKEDYRASFVHGWIIGWHNVATPGGVPNLGSGGDNRTFNMTTVRYGINNKNNGGLGWTNNPGNCGSQGICFNASTNLPPNSAHPGGVNFALGDGSVRFVSQTMELLTLARFVTRDDGATNELP
jgi:prepilin-type processing-associated H-X9-DG protein